MHLLVLVWSLLLVAILSLLLAGSLGQQEFLLGVRVLGALAEQAWEAVLRLLG